MQHIEYKTVQPESIMLIHIQEVLSNIVLTFHHFKCLLSPFGQIMLWGLLAMIKGADTQTLFLNVEKH